MPRSRELSIMKKLLPRALFVSGAALLTLGATAGSCTPRPSRWVPKVGETWQYQLQGSINTSVKAAVFDVDGFDTPSSVVATLHRHRAHVVCYISAGSWENWRPDAHAFPSRVLGSSNGWPGEKWLDIRQVAVLRPIMAKRFDLCKTKGFDAVEPDNVDGYTNRTGFPLTAANQSTYNKMLAGLAHDRGLRVGLKNDLDQAGSLRGSFDSECGTLSSFIAAGKPVFNVEYKGATGSFCPKARALKFSSIFKHMNLDAYRVAC
jgi:hypothetical protein